MFPLFLMGQMIYDTLDLKAVEILGVNFDKRAGYRTLKLDSVTLESHSSGSLADLLIVSAPLFVKSYGQGSLASSSIRGASASHTQVIWNGMNINSPMPGQTDFSSIPVSVIDHASVYFGSGSMAHSSGGLGGSVDLSTTADWQNRLKVSLQQEIADFGTRKFRGMVSFGDATFQSSTRIYLGRSENDFSFLNNALSRKNPPTEKRDNAAWNRQGVLQQLYWKPGKQTILSAKVWMQKQHREIPSNIMVQVPEGNEKLQEDFIRSLLRMEQFVAGGKLTAQSGFIHNNLNYTNKISGTDSKNIVNSSLNIISYEHQGIENLLLNISAGFDFHQVRSGNYETHKYRRHGNLCIGASYQIASRFNVNALLRQEVVDDHVAPPAPSLGFKYRLLKDEKLDVKGNISRNFHAPSLNDLFWVPGGNPQLDYETGFSSEAGLTYAKTMGTIELKADAGYFYSDIDNWIMWQPDSVFSYWRPSNLLNVISQGIETGISAEGNFAGITWKYSLMYTGTSAKNQAARAETDQSVQKQLVYVPEHLVIQNLYAAFSGFGIGYHYNYTGKRYTTSDNSRYLPGFTVHDLWLSKELNLGKSAIAIRFAVNNLTGTNYQVIAWQPMPGRNFSLTLKYIFNKPQQ
ncbi:MAG: TonB-dependent receptor [Bacteroidales bacterium]